MALSEPSVTLLHICSVCKEQEPQEIQMAYEVKFITLGEKAVFKWLWQFIHITAPEHVSILTISLSVRLCIFFWMNLLLNQGRFSV